MIESRKGQAIMELAILGSLVIMAFSIVINLSENYNRRQSYMQQTFRGTLYKAQDANDTGTVGTVDFRRLPNVTDPMSIGAFQQYSSGNSVYWSDGKKKDGDFTKSKVYFLRNRGRYEPIATLPSGALPGAVSSSTTSYSSDVAAHDWGEKWENDNIITTHKTLRASGSVGGTTNVGGLQVATGGSLEAGGLYSRGAGEFYRATGSSRNNN
jgi:hypothetical protein